jgi:transglutaminase-like putative cysteine protease
MNRRSFLKSGVALPLATAGTAGAVRTAFGAAPAGEWRSFEITQRAELLEPAGVTKVWLPVPLLEETDYQHNLGTTWHAESGAARFYVVLPYDAAGLVCAEFPAGTRSPELVVTSRVATRYREVDLSGPGHALPEEPAILQHNLRPTELLPTGGIVHDTARQITQGAGTDLEKAHAIYEWIVVNTFRDPKTKGCGWGDVQSMLETKNLGGKCADLNALYVALARSAGVPARDVYGIRIAPSQLGYKSLGASSPVISKAQHCRAEFYLAGHGWVPVDPADVRKVVLEERPGLTLDSPVVKANRKRLFGQWEMNWMAFNYAHDVALPNSRGPKIPYLMYPNGETAHGRLDSLDPSRFKYSITAREVTA